MKTLATILIALILFNGCSTRKISPSYNSGSEEKSLILYKEYKRWKKTPYKYGGNTLKGADCSGFVQQVYFNAFGKKMPRTTMEQVRVGYKIAKSSLRAGDLILFRIKNGVRHSGIMLDKKKFMHSSSSKGITISSIDNSYWQKKYWQARRVLE